MHRRELRGSVGALAWALATLLASSAMAAQGDEEAAQGPGLGAKLANWVTAGETGGSLQYGVGVVEVGGLVGGLAGSGGLATGVHYTERGSVLAQLLFAGGAGAGPGRARRRPRRTRTTPST
jgi:hypothetical protein